MRVTTSMTMRSALQDLNQSMTRLRDSQTDVATGKKIRTVSDDPLRAMDALTTRGALRRAEQRSRTASDAEARLRIADTALVSGLDMLSRAKELAVRASNSGASDPAARAAIAVEMSAIREEMLAIANTEYLGRSIFNGTAAGQAYDPSSGTYLGNDAGITRNVASGVTITANLTGEQVFGAQAGPDGDMFAVLDRLATSIAAGDQTAIEAEHGHLDVARDRMGTATAQVGARAARLDGIRTRAAADEAGLRERLTLTEDVDMAEALLTMQADENAYNAALQATARILTPSLLDYLR